MSGFDTTIHVESCWECPWNENRFMIPTRMFHETDRWVSVKCQKLSQSWIVKEDKLKFRIHPNCPEMGCK